MPADTTSAPSTASELYEELWQKAKELRHEIRGNREKLLPGHEGGAAARKLKEEIDRLTEELDRLPGAGRPSGRPSEEDSGGDSSGEEEGPGLRTTVIVVRKEVHNSFHEIQLGPGEKLADAVERVEEGGGNELRREYERTLPVSEWEVITESGSTISDTRQLSHPTF